MKHKRMLQILSHLTKHVEAKQCFVLWVFVLRYRIRRSGIDWIRCAGPPPANRRPSCPPLYRLIHTARVRSVTSPLSSPLTWVRIGQSGPPTVQLANRTGDHFEQWLREHSPNVGTVTHSGVMAGQNGEPDPFGRRSVAGEGVDPFESMREQMDRERENFFRGVNPRDWPNEGAAARGGLFNRVSLNRKTASSSSSSCRALNIYSVLESTVD